MRFFALAILITVAIEASGQDPIKADLRHYKVEFENARVRIVRVHFGPHYKSVMNETPPRVVVLLTGARKPPSIRAQSNKERADAATRNENRLRRHGRTSALAFQSS